MRKLATLLVTCCIGTLAIAQGFPALPASMSTSKGTLTNARITGVSGDTVKVLHDGGISALSAADLPADVCTALGLTAATAAPLPTLPETITVGEKTYTQVKLSTLEPDGIRITHSGGAAQIRYELLSPELQKLLGGFDRAKADAHRTATAAARQEALKAAAAQRAAALPSSDPAPANEAMEKQGPVTQNPSIRLAAKSIAGGRSTAVTWSTTWGSFNKESSSSRVIAVTVSTVARVPQQTDVEVLFLWRNLETRELEVTTTGTKTAIVVDGHPTTMAAEDQAEDTHDKYAALGTEEKTGKRYVGWVARAVDEDGRVVAVYASTPAYEKYGYAKL